MWGGCCDLQSLPVFETVVVRIGPEFIHLVGLEIVGSESMVEKLVVFVRVGLHLFHYANGFFIIPGKTLI